jgi:molybdopterin synthase sulfur carrier subunit
MMAAGVKVLLFGPLRDLAGWRERTVEPAPATLSALKTLLGGLDSRLGAALDGPGVKAAVDKAITPGDPSLRPGCEVAFLPPMSGG